MKDLSNILKYKSNKNDKNTFDGKNIVIDEYLQEYFMVINDRYVIPWLFENLTFYPETELESIQKGYTYNSLTNEKNEDWKDNWIVFALCAGDPFIYDLHTQKVYTALHGKGSWELVKIANSLIDFLELISCWIDAYELENGIIYDPETYELNYDLIIVFKDMVMEYSLFENVDWGGIMKIYGIEYQS